ncbi:MAG: hypothetical protein ACKOSQ_03060 [Planctomycetaceae bacterium]
MTLVIGTDEAGYGPNLGPLVVAATAWHVAAPPEAAEALLAAAVAEARHADGRPLWADSKQVLRGAGGFAALETGALVGLALATGAVPASWSAVAGASDAGPLETAPEDAALAALALPIEAARDAVTGLVTGVRARLATHGVELAAVRVHVVRPGAFNAILDRGLNKSDLLSQATLDLAATTRADATGPTLVWCDRHGGRRRYAGLVARHFGATLVQAAEETAARSSYEVPAASLRVEFSVGGEARAPVALASMTAKYVRELAMRAFNTHWGARCPGLEPTAGYPVDAARWRREAGAAVERAGVAWDEIWRRA